MMEQSRAWIICLGLKLTRNALQTYQDRIKNGANMMGNVSYTDLIRILGMERFFAENGAQYEVKNCVSYGSNLWAPDPRYSIENSHFDFCNKKSWKSAIHGTLKDFKNEIKMVILEWRHMTGSIGYGNLFEKIIHNEVLEEIAKLLQKNGVILVPGKKNLYDALCSKRKDGRTTYMERYFLTCTDA